MKGVLMKLNHVSTFLGEGQFVILHCLVMSKKQRYRKESTEVKTPPGRFLLCVRLRSIETLQGVYNSQLYTLLPKISSV
jgi:hypothetical protein